MSAERYDIANGTSSNIRVNLASRAKFHRIFSWEQFIVRLDCECEAFFFLSAAITIRFCKRITVKFAFKIYPVFIEVRDRNDNAYTGRYRQDEGYSARAADDAEATILDVAF